MKKIILCGHTGSNNRGCEAIVRSSVYILKSSDIELEMGSFAKVQDEKLGLDNIINIVEYRGYKNRYSPQRIYNGFSKKIFKNNMPEQKYIQKNIFERVKNADAALVIGGDTYCYGRPVTAYSLNKYAHSKKVKTVLWSCSVEKAKITSEMKDDLNRYSMIFPRETITYNSLRECGISEDKLFLMSDSAFALQPEEVILPDAFENVLAYNPSYTIYKAGERVSENRDKLIENILKNTDLKIALVPHVYDTDFGDAVVCKEIFEKYRNTNRLFLFDDIYNCMQLKYIISKCRFLVAERTHASIAGYSTCVPTFVLGYSVKSKGIAQDIFAQNEHYVYPSDKLFDENTYWNEIQYMLQNEAKIKTHLETIMPEYIKKAKLAGEKLKQIL